jgi:hypothetical protein
MILLSRGVACIRRSMYQVTAIGPWIWYDKVWEGSGWQQQLLLAVLLVSLR